MERLEGGGAANRYNFEKLKKIMWYTFMKPTLCSSYCGSLFHSVAMRVTFHKKKDAFAIYCLESRAGQLK